ncbi:MAG: hypothetical protein PUP91_25275 [Rhizonema sp. PD37]|nr:hypothetical protein [Rhizonema sp. PD37]
MSDSFAHSAGTDALWEKPIFELDFVNAQQVSLEWIQSLPPELKDVALYRLCRVIESKPTLVESFTINQVLYRTLSGGKFTESADHVAKRTGCDRKTILKGLSIAVSQNILEKSDRPGTSSEYFFKPVEEWKPEPVRIADIRTKKVIEFPLTQNTDDGDRVVHETDDPETDLNVVVVNKFLNKQQDVSVPILDTPSIWRSHPDATRYCQIPPIYDQDTGVEIQRQMDSEGLTAQKVVGRAIAFSKVPLLILEVLANVGSRLLNLIRITVSEGEVLGREASAPKTSPSGTAATFPTEIMLLLKNADIYLVPAKAEKLWTAYSEKFVEAISYVDLKAKEGKVTNREGYFVKCLEEGWLVKKIEPEKRDPHTLTPEQQQWYDWACVTGICINTPVKDLPTKMGVLAVLSPIKDRRTFDPPYDLVAIDMAMREYPMS